MSGGTEDEQAYLFYLHAGCLLPVGADQPGTERYHRLGGHCSTRYQQCNFPSAAGKFRGAACDHQPCWYNATMAIKGGYQPYGEPISAPRGADVRAAVATAAYQTARARVDPTQVAYLDLQYQTYLATIPDGPAKNNGVQVGEAAATAMLVLRSNDDFNNLVLYECSSTSPPVGEFEPNGGCVTQPVDAPDLGILDGIHDACPMSRRTLANGWLRGPSQN
jgi:hypothetical protein